MAGQHYLPLPAWINARIHSAIARGADVRIWTANPLERIRPPAGHPLEQQTATQYVPRIALDAGTPVPSAPVAISDPSRPYWLLVNKPGASWVRDGYEPETTLYDIAVYGFPFDPNEPGKHWAGFSVTPGGLVTPMAPQNKSHFNDALGLGLLLVGGTVVAGELFAGSAAGAGAGAEAGVSFAVPAGTAEPGLLGSIVEGSGAVELAEGAAVASDFMGPAAPPAPTVAPPSSAISTIKSAADAINTAAATAANVVGAAAAVKGAWTDPEPATPKPPPDKTDWMLYATAAVVSVLLLTQGAKA